MGAQLTTGEVAELLGVDVWRVRRLYESGMLPEPPRAGAYRLIPKADLPRIIDAMRQRGWLPAASSAEAASA